MGKYNKKKPEKSDKAEHQRFCSNCKKVSYSWSCCGQRTRRVNMTRTLGQVVESK